MALFGARRFEQSERPPYDGVKDVAHDGRLGETAFLMLVVLIALAGLAVAGITLLCQPLL